MGARSLLEPGKDLLGRQHEKSYLQFAEESLGELASMNAVAGIPVAAAYAR